MRLIRLGLLSIVLLFLVVTAISLLIPPEIRISKAINLKASKEKIFSLVGDTSNWKLWHPAFVPGDTMHPFPQFRVVKQHQTASELVMHLQQPGKPVVVNGWKIHDYSHTDSVTLQWYMDFHLEWYPWRKFASLFFEQTYGVMMEQGLEALKIRTESDN